MSGMGMRRGEAGTAARVVRVARARLASGDAAGAYCVLGRLERRLMRRGAAGGAVRGKGPFRKTPGPAGGESALRARNLARFMLHGFASQVQGGQRSSAYSLRECLDDVESLMETLLESLSDMCHRPG